VIGSKSRELLMAVLLRNPGAFDRVRELLTPETFRYAGDAYAALWEITIAFVNEHGHMPEREFLLTALENSEQGYGTVGEESYDEAVQLIEYAFSPATFLHPPENNNEYAGWAVRTASKLLHEQLATAMQGQLLSRSTVPEDMPLFISTLTSQIESITAMTCATVDELAYTENWDQTIQRTLTPTGIPFFDIYTAGGDCPGEVYGVMGPYGSYKTTLVYMLAVERCCRLQAMMEADPSSSRKVVVVFSYEARLTEMRQRALGYAAKMPRDRLEHTPRSEYSTADNLQTYERLEFAGQLSAGLPVLGEIDRVNNAIAMLNQHVIYVDMTGSTEESRGRGNGYFDEIKTMLGSFCRQRNVEISSVIMDYVGIAAKRHMLTKNIDMSQMRHYIGNAPMMAKSIIADRFNCPVYLFHQLAAAANNLGEGRIGHHTDAAEAKNFPENCDFCMQGAMPNGAALAAWGCTKHRRAPQMENRILHVQGNMYRVSDASATYTIRNGRIVGRREDEMIVHGDARQRQQRQLTDDYNQANGEPNEADSAG